MDSSRIYIENPVNNDVYLQMLFNGFRELQNKKPEPITDTLVDKDKIKKIRETVGKIHENILTQQVKYIRRPVPQFENNTLTEESWEECLDYYEIMMDRLGENKPYDVERLLELELWFYPLIEPISEDKGRWYSRETTKVTKYHSAYLPNHLQEIVSYLVYEQIGKEGAQSHLDKINSLV